MKIPKIIHQIWSGVDEPLPFYFEELGKTWKRDYPDWEYVLWDNKMMTDFIVTHYLQYLKVYESFQYNVQRWDAIRYLILDKMGGMYVDIDYESIEPMDELIRDKTCCFSIEPETHRKNFKRPDDDVFNNAMMLSVPDHPFIGRIIEEVFCEDERPELPATKFHQVMYRTGPGMLVELYYRLPPEERESIYLIPAKYVSPFDIDQAQRLRLGDTSDELENCLDEAYAVHYFFSNWSRTKD